MRMIGLANQLEGLYYLKFIQVKLNPSVHMLAGKFRLRGKANFDQGIHRKLLDRRVCEVVDQHEQASVEAKRF